MNKAQKKEIIDHIAQQFQSGDFYITNPQGINVATVNQLRAQCFQAGIKYQVVKNTLIKKALEQIGQEAVAQELSEEVLKGASSLFFVQENPSAPAKLLKKFYKNSAQGRPVLKAACVDSELLIGEKHLKTLTDLKSKEELIGILVNMLQAPIYRVIGGLQSSSHNLSGILQTLSKKDN